MKMNRKLLSAAAMMSMVSGMAMAQASECSKGSEKTVECEVVVECEGGETAEALQSGEYQIVMVTDDNGETTVKVQPEVRVETHVIMIQEDDDHEFKIEMKGDDVKAWVDGERVPKKRLKVNDEEIRILDKNGETIAEFARMNNIHIGHANGDGEFADAMIMLRGMVDGEGSSFGWEDDHGDRRFHLRVEGDKGGRWFAGDDEHDIWANSQVIIGQQPDFNHPPVMLGISMGGMDEDLADDLDMDADEGIVITNVIEGLPADEAGLREGDVIIEVEGESPVDSELILDYLNDREPGDELEVTILRRGRERVVDIELAEYNPEALGILSYDVEVERGENPLWEFFGDRNMEGFDGEALHERLQMLQRENPEAFEGDMQQLQLMLPQLLERGQPHELDAFPRIRTWRGEEGRDGRFVVAPSPRGEAMRGYDDRFDRMEERLERLENRIDRLINALEGRERNRD